MLNKVIADQNPTPETEEKISSPYLHETVRGNANEPLLDMFKKMVETKSVKEKREIARNMVIQTIEDSKINGDSFDIEKHYTTPELQIGRYENMMCKLNSTRHKNPRSSSRNPIHARKRHQRAKKKGQNGCIQRQPQNLERFGQ